MGSEKLLFRLEQPHGPGDIYIAWQKGSGNYLVTTGVDGIVNIFDRYGQIHEKIRLQSLCNGFAWDSDGDILGIISQSPQLTLWDANTNKKHVIDVGLRDTMTCILWAKSSPILAVGTAKGNISIYNHSTSKRIPIIAKHTKKVTCGAWNSENLLALGSEDKTISISNLEGDTLRVIALRAEPTEVEFSEMKLDERVGGENTVSVIVGKKTLYLYNLLDPENPIELAFQQHYGTIMTYKWFGDGYILIGFSSGYFIAISTHIKEVGQELFQIKNHKLNLTNIALSENVGKVASCGDNVVKIHDVSNLQETLSVITLNQEIGLDRVAWSHDGQLLGVCTRSGSLNVYVSHMSILTSVCGPRIAILSSLTEVSLYNFTTEKNKMTPIPVSLETEPQIISVGPYNLAAALNNRAWYYDLTRPQPGTEDAPLMLKDRQYLGSITSIRLNAEYSSVLFDGKIHLHMIEQPEPEHESRESIIFPDTNSPSGIIKCHALTTEFLIYGTNVGHIVYFSIEEWALAIQYKHTTGVQELHLDPAGTRLIFIDDKSQVFLFNAVNSEILPILTLPNKVNGVTWDSNLSDRNIFIIFDEHEIFTYLYVKFSVNGSSIKDVGKTILASNQTPLLMYGGEIMSATSGGQITQLTLSTHDSSIQTSISDKEKSGKRNNFNKQLNLHRFSQAWNTCLVLQDKECWNMLATEALNNLDIEIAIRIYKQLGNVSMVYSLQNLIDIEDQKLLCGYVAMYLNEFDKAQNWFLKSGYNTAALEMRRDLLQWDQALQLAKKFAPEEISLISKEYAQQLEFTGNYSEAYVHYEKACTENISPEHVLTCKAGIARTSVRCGNYKHGINVALELNNNQLNKDCADILESKKQLPEAAMLYEKSGSFDKAASVYIRLKNWTKVGELIPNVTSNKIHIQYAKAKENEGKYQEAVQAYYAAKDFDSIIRLQLEYLNNPEIAVELVQETKSVEGAKMVAKFFQKLNDCPTAIRFLVLSKCHDEAFELARKNSKLQLYGEILLNSLDPDEIKPEYFNSLALYFENERNYLYSGKYWYHAKEYHKAMKHLLRASKLNSDENEAISTTIDVVASSNDESLSNELIEYLLGEVDGVPKDPKYLFRLYMARKQFKEASKSAIIIANEEQVNGNYRNSHDVLFGMYQELKQNGLKVPYDMHANLMLLHSYILVRLHVKRSDHIKGARMLIRVANNISKFPSHIVPILTSAVIECHRAGLRQAANKFATLLMKPEYRKKIDPKYGKKIEAVVRKPPKLGIDGEKIEDPLELLTPCPYCGNLIPETEVYCNACKNNIPYCIITGRHVIASDLTACPECDFPAIYSEFIKLVETEELCPMCSEKVDSKRLQNIQDFKRYLNFE